MKQLEKFETLFGKKINRVGFGGIPIQRLSVTDSDRVLEYALSKGINFIDTARGYSDSEEKIGRAIKNKSKEVFLATKSMARTSDQMKKEIAVSLKNFQTDLIHLYQLHGVGTKDDLDAVLDKNNGAINALLEAKNASKIKCIGITGHIPEVLVKAVKTDMFDSVQVPHNVIETECEKELIPLCKEKAVPVIAMKPIGGGALGKVASLNLRYVLNNGSTVVIPGIDEIGQVDDALSILPDISTLSENEYAVLKKEKDTWNGKFCRRCGYCMPCPQGLKIPFLLLLQAYWERYNMEKWVIERFSPLEKKYSDCKKCGECREKCPYTLPIEEMMERGKQSIEKVFIENSKSDGCAV